MLASLSLLVFLPLFSAIKGLEPAEPSRSPLVDLPECKSTTWRDTFNMATYVAVVDVITTAWQSPGLFNVSYIEVFRYKGDAPLQLQTAEDPMLPGRRYLVATQQDGRLYYCNGFATVDRGIPSGVPQYMDVSPHLIGRLWQWSKQAPPQKKLSGGLFGDF